MQTSLRRMLTTLLFTTVCLSGLAQPVDAFAGPIVGQPLPDHRFPTVERADTVALSQFRGKKLLLIEFASW